MKYRSYPEYKATGIRWLGKVPVHWEIKRYKHIFSECDERSTTGSELLLSVSSYTGITPRSEILDSDDDNLSRAESLVGYKICNAGDLVMNIMLAWNGALGFTSYDGIVSPAYAVFSQKSNDDSRFLNYLLRDPKTNLYFKCFSTGVMDSRLRLYPDKFGALYCAVPSKTEQLQISEFLDKEISKVDQLISKQEELIVLLIERRAAIISKGVTRGFVNHPLKDSGIEWLGAVPESWSVRRLNFLSRTHKLTISPDDLSGKMVRHYSIPSVQSSAGALVEDGDEIDSNKILIECRQLLVSKLNPHKQTLLIVDKDEEYITVASSEFVPIIPISVDINYLKYVWMSTETLNYLKARIESATRSHQRVSPADITKLKWAWPSLDEQQQIAKILNKETREIDELISKAKSSILLLNEFRASVISHAVTGKIDVRFMEN